MDKCKLANMPRTILKSRLRPLNARLKTWHDQGKYMTEDNANDMMPNYKLKTRLNI